MTGARPVVIVDYDPRWPQVFLDLSRVIGGALGGGALAIEHVGSTAVPGLPAKPIIDVDVVIASDDQLPAVIRILASLGYVLQGDLGVPQREAFGRQGDDAPRGAAGGTWPEHHLYVCRQDSRELRRHLAFRDFLRANPREAAAYGMLKRRLADAFRTDREAYVAGKTEFIEAVLQRIADGSYGGSPRAAQHE
jgi:GrpB-like predicted nucleotidyltransferase (UPF0157 family)